MAASFNVTISQTPSGGSECRAEWEQLVRHVSENESDLVVLPEMPFYRWLPASDDVDDSEWDAAVAAHDKWVARLEELAPAAVASSRPVTRDGKRLNEGFIWTTDTGYRSVHHKAYLPNEEGFWEASWYDPGPPDFVKSDVGSVSVGFLICTELWDMKRAREYGREGVNLIITPRATGAATREKWDAAGRTAAVVAGAFSVSANRAETDNTLEFAGQGWCFSPDGERLAVTNDENPVATVSIIPTDAERAQETYPRYALE